MLTIARVVLLKSGRLFINPPLPHIMDGVENDTAQGIVLVVLVRHGA